MLMDISGASGAPRLAWLVRRSNLKAEGELVHGLGVPSFFLSSGFHFLRAGLALDPGD